MTDRKLLEAAAKAAGMTQGKHRALGGLLMANDLYWDPLTDDGDALRLAVELRISADFFDDAIYVGYTPLDNECDQVEEPVGSDPYAATRRAIVRAAAEIGRQA